jgi:hypothetical protein
MSTNNLPELTGLKGGPRGRPPGSRDKAPRSAYPRFAGLQPKPKPGSPLYYMLEIMNDPNATQARRDRMASECLPYCHAKKSEYATRIGKKEQKAVEAEAAAQDSKWGNKLQAWRT